MLSGDLALLFIKLVVVVPSVGASKNLLQFFHPIFVNNVGLQDAPLEAGEFYLFDLTQGQEARIEDVLRSLCTHIWQAYREQDHVSYSFPGLAQPWKCTEKGLHYIVRSRVGKLVI